MVGGLDSGSSSPGSSPGRGHRTVFKTLNSQSTPLHSQTYRWVPVPSHPIEILLVSSYVTKVGMSSHPMGRLARMQMCLFYLVSNRCLR